MNSLHDQGTPTFHSGAERRTHPHLREIFDQAYRVVTPLLDPNVSSTAHFLHITLHDAFPHLHPQDISILCVAIERVYRESKK